MFSVADYLERFDALIQQFGGLFREEPTIKLDPSDTVAQYKARAFFADDSHLSAHVTVTTAAGFPQMLTYSYHYQDQRGTVIFRYDSAPHHFDISPLPHHKHIGPRDELVATEGAPSLHAVLSEVLGHVRRQHP